MARLYRSYQVWLSGRCVERYDHLNNARIRAGAEAHRLPANVFVEIRTVCQGKVLRVQRVSGKLPSSLTAVAVCIGPLSPICVRVRFSDQNDATAYSYLWRGHEPIAVGDLAVVESPYPEPGSLKIVRVVEVLTEPDDRATKTLLGLVRPDPALDVSRVRIGPRGFLLPAYAILNDSEEM